MEREKFFIHVLHILTIPAITVTKQQKDTLASLSQILVVILFFHVPEKHLQRQLLEISTITVLLLELDFHPAQKIALSLHLVYYQFGN